MSEEEAFQVAETFLSACGILYSRCYARTQRRNCEMPQCDLQKETITTGIRKLVWCFCYVSHETPPNVVEDRTTFFVYIDDETGRTSYLSGP